MGWDSFVENPKEAKLFSSFGRASNYAEKLRNNIKLDDSCVAILASSSTQEDLEAQLQSDKNFANKVKFEDDEDDEILTF